MAANAADLRIGKGIISFKKDGDADFRDLGFCPTFDVTPNPTRKPYYSARDGISTLVQNPVTKVESNVKFTMNEVNGDNLSYFALGDVDTSTPGQTKILSLTQNEILGTLKCEGTNDVGRHVDWTGRVQLGPTGTFNLITDGDDYSKIDVDAYVLKDDTFGYGQYIVHDLT